MNRPRPDVYEIPNLKPEMSLKKIVATFGAVFIFFVIPVVAIEAITHPNNLQNISGRVAGISTTLSNEGTASNIINFFGLQINLNSQTGLIAMGGFLLVGIAIILAFYLLIETLKSHPQQKKKD